MPRNYIQFEQQETFRQSLPNTSQNISLKNKSTEASLNIPTFRQGETAAYIKVHVNQNEGRLERSEASREQNKDEVRADLRRGIFKIAVHIDRSKEIIDKRGPQIWDRPDCL